MKASPLMLGSLCFSLSASIERTGIDLIFSGLLRRQRRKRGASKMIMSKQRLLCRVACLTLQV